MISWSAPIKGSIAVGDVGGDPQGSAAAALGATAATSGCAEF
jgi:hypothetical protein